MERERVVAPPQARYTTRRSRPPKPTPPNGRWRPLADRSGLSSIARTKMLFRQARQQSGPHAVESPPTQPRFGLHPDDTTPIPRPSHYYGRRHHGSMTDLLRQDQAKAKIARVPPLASCRERIASDQDRQEPAHDCRTQTIARQGTPEIRCLTALPHLRPAAVRSPSPAVCTTESHRSQGER